MGFIKLVYQILVAGLGGQKLPFQPFVLLRAFLLPI